MLALQFKLINDIDDTAMLSIILKNHMLKKATLWIKAKADKLHPHD